MNPYVIDGIDPDTPGGLNDWIKQIAAEQARVREGRARELVYLTLRPRLRWAASRPRALSLLKRLRIWTPPGVTPEMIRLEEAIRGVQESVSYQKFRIQYP